MTTSPGTENDGCHLMVTDNPAFGERSVAAEVWISAPISVPSPGVREFYTRSMERLD
jgi:hypothetical protein